MVPANPGSPFKGTSASFCPCFWHSPQLAGQASRVHLLGGNCAAEDGVPQDLLRASHLILTMRRRDCVRWVKHHER